MSNYSFTLRQEKKILQRCAWHQFFCEHILHSSQQTAFNLYQNSSQVESFFKSLDRWKSLNEVIGLFSLFIIILKILFLAALSEKNIIRVLITICKKSLKLVTSFHILNDYTNVILNEISACCLSNKAWEYVSKSQDYRMSLHWAGLGNWYLKRSRSSYSSLIYLWTPLKVLFPHKLRSEKWCGR